MEEKAVFMLRRKVNIDHPFFLTVKNIPFYGDFYIMGNFKCK